MTDPSRYQAASAPSRGDLLRVLIADEDPDSRVAARKAVQRTALDVAGETGYGTAAASLALSVNPDVVLIAVEEPAARPLETAQALADALPDTPIIVYSSDDSAAAIHRSLVFGARDYLLKPLQSADLRAAILRALEAEERRHLRRAGQLDTAAGRGTVITVTGAKGGIGKTVVSVNLALALRLQTGKSVLLLDADTQFGDVATMLDLTPVATVSDVVSHVDGLERDRLRDYLTHHQSGMDILPAPIEDGSWEAIGAAGIQRVLELTSQLYEFVVIDTAGAFDAIVRACIDASTLVLMVTSGEVSSIRDTAAALHRLEGWNVPADRVRIILDRGRTAGGVELADLQNALQRDIFWEIPFDKSVPRSVQFGRPLVAETKHTPFARSLIELAQRTAGTTRPLIPQLTARQPFWKRLGRLRGKTSDTAMASVPEVPETRR